MNFKNPNHIISRISQGRLFLYEVWTLWNLSFLVMLQTNRWTHMSYPHRPTVARVIIPLFSTCPVIRHHVCLHVTAWNTSGEVRWCNERFQHAAGQVQRFMPRANTATTPNQYVTVVFPSVSDMLCSCVLLLCVFYLYCVSARFLWFL